MPINFKGTFSGIPCVISPSFSYIITSFIPGLSDAIVVDIGGTTTDIGVLMSSFPREAATHMTVGGVRTNFRMPDVKSLGLGGGSIIMKEPKVRKPVITFV